MSKTGLSFLGFAVALGVAAVLMYLRNGIEGVYSGSVLDRLSVDAALVLRAGEAFIRRPDGDLDPYGRYTNEGGRWKMLETPGGGTWTIQKRLLGFDLVNPTNTNERYHFTRKLID